MASVEKPHPLQEAIGKHSLALNLDPQPLQGTASGTGPEASGCHAQAGAHQENSREQKFASCSGLGFSSGDTGCILLAWTDVGRGHGVGATRRCEARPLAPLMEAVGELHSTGHGTPGALVPALGCKLYQRARSEPRPPPRRGKGRLQQKRPSAVVKTRRRRKLAEGDSSPPSGHAALIRTKQGRCGKVSNWNGAGPWGAFLG